MKSFDWKGKARLHLGNTATSFALPQIFSGLHFTISHVEHNEFVNFHMSGDTGPVNNKAKLVIAKIKKTDLDQLFRAFNQAFWNVQLIPFDVKKYRYKKPKRDFRAYYFLLNGFENSPDYPEFKETLTRIFDDHSRKKNGKMEIHEDIDLAYQDAIRLPQHSYRLRNNFRKFTGRTALQYDYGIFISKQYTGLAIYAQGRWFRLKSEFNLMELMSSCVPEPLAKKLSFKFVMALARMRKATSYDEIKMYNIPVNLSANN